MYFAELKVGDKFKGKTVTITEGHMVIPTLVLDIPTGPLHGNDEFARKLGFKGRIVAGPVICMVALESITAFFGPDKIFANLENHFIFRQAVYIRDTICNECEIIELTPKKRFGMVKTNLTTRNQDGQVVMEGWAGIGVRYKLDPS